jgi:hypothetical protein
MQEEVTTECSDESIVQHGLFGRSSRENATAISSSKISHSGGVHENICGDSTVQDDPLIQVKFT